MTTRFRDVAADLLAALGLFTRLPLGWLERHAGPVSLSRSIWLWPLIGGAIGAGTGLLASVGLRLGLPPFIAALCAVMGQLFLTGGLHEDGLADTADGCGGGSVEKRLAIMRDSRIGTYGALALFTCVLLRVACVAALPPGILLPGLALAGMLARASLLTLLATTAAARRDGLAAALLPLPRPPLRLAALTVPGIGLFLAPAATVADAVMAALLVTLLMRRFTRHSLGGFTGDTLGATAILSELAVLLVLVASRS